MFDHLSTEKAYPLDITPLKERGEHLREAIFKAVKDTQSVIVRALPDRLIMTVAQYNDLSGTPEMMRMYDKTGQVLQTNWLYRTPMNVMEVEVKE